MKQKWGGKGQTCEFLWLALRRASRLPHPGTRRKGCSAQSLWTGKEQETIYRLKRPDEIIHFWRNRLRSSNEHFLQRAIRGGRCLGNRWLLCVSAPSVAELQSGTQTLTNKLNPVAPLHERQVQQPVLQGSEGSTLLRTAAFLCPRSWRGTSKWHSSPCSLTQQAFPHWPDQPLQVHLPSLAPSGDEQGAAYTWGTMTYFEKLAFELGNYLKILSLESKP